MKLYILILFLFSVSVSTQSADTVRYSDIEKIPENRTWWAKGYESRLPIQVYTGSASRSNRIVEISIAKNSSLDQFIENSVDLVLVEINEEGKVIQSNLSHQIIHSPNTDSSFIFQLKGNTPNDTLRYYDFYNTRKDVKQSMNAIKKQVVRKPNVYHEKQDSFHISTPVADYFYHIQGAGFASIEDRDGNDWLSYNPGVGKESQSGSGGVYRGIPNMGYPEGYNHPGKKVSVSRVLSEGQLCVRILSESNDGKMQCMWDIFPYHARMTILKMRTPYWFLYEGTPGGELDPETDFCVRMVDGEFVRTPVSEKWEGDLPSDQGAEWLYYGDGNRSIVLMHHEEDEGTDSYWMMNKEMTVFGFGRSGLNKYMIQVPARFSVALVDSNDPHTIQNYVQSIHQPLTVTVGSVEKQKD